MHAPLQARQTTSGAYRLETPDGSDDAWIEMYDPVDTQEVA